MSDDGGTCDLTISPVLPADEARYQCQVGPGHGDSAIISRHARVRVVTDPGVPYITQATDSDVIEVITQRMI